MARKFKKRLAPKRIVKKTKAPVLSVELVRKEYLQKVKSFVDKVISLTKNFKFKNI